MAEEPQMSAEEFINLPAQEIRDYLSSGKVPPALTPEQIAQLPPGTEMTYAMQRSLAEGMLIVPTVNAKNFGAAQIAEKERQSELARYDVEYRDGVPASDSDYRGYDHAVLKSYVESIRGEDITVYADTYHDLHNLFQRLSDELRQAVGKSKAGWEGEAADGAHNYFTSLSDWSEGNSQNARMASEIIAAESEAAVRARNAMPDPVPFDLEREMDNLGSNGLSLIEDFLRIQQKQEESRSKHDEAVQVMTQYDFDLQEAGNKQPVFAEPPKFEGASGSGGTNASGVITIGDPSTSASGFSGGVTGSSGGSVNVPSGGPGTGPSGGSGGSFTPVAPGVSTGAGPRPGTTRPSGLQPNGLRPSFPGGRNNNRSTFGPGGGGGFGPMPMGLGGGFGPGGGPGGGGYGGGRMSAGGFGPGGGAAGPGAGPGAGAATGAKPMGGPVAGPGGAAPGAAAAARGAGMAGGPMGAGGAKGKGDEDSEHQRPTYLVEADPDEVFGTSQRTAPPVIGA